MFTHNFDPVLIDLYIFEVRWYSLAYIVGILVGWIYAKKIIKHLKTNSNLRYLEIKDFEFFIKELERISSKGYIELPSRLGDNLVFENKNDHVWWFYYDDITNQLIVSKKNQLIDPFITVSMAKLFEKIFRESLVVELAWEEKIEYKIDNSIRQEDFKKISFFKIFKKYLSKKIRTIFK